MTTIQVTQDNSGTEKKTGGGAGSRIAKQDSYLRTQKPLADRLTVSREQITEYLNKSGMGIKDIMPAAASAIEAQKVSSLDLGGVTYLVYPHAHATGVLDHIFSFDGGLVDVKSKVHLTANISENSLVLGKSVIADFVHISNSTIIDSKILGSQNRIRNSLIVEATIARNTDVTDGEPRYWMSGGP